MAYYEIGKRLTSRPQRLLQVLLLLIALTIVFYLASQSHISLNQPAPSSLTRHVGWRVSSMNSKQRFPSVICLVLTKATNKDKVAAVNQTWGKRCDRLLFVYGAASSTRIDGDKLYLTTKESRNDLPYKMKAALDYVYTVFNTTYDWILKADDDTYMIMENLKMMLARFDHRDSNYLGAHFKLLVENGYMSGGAGYILSSRALQDIVEIAFRKGVCKQTNRNEDVQIGLCLQLVNATVRNTSDVEEMETFHADGLLPYLTPPHPKWLINYMWNKVKFTRFHLDAELASAMFQKFLDKRQEAAVYIGHECCARYTVSFHRIKPGDMYVFDHLLYRTSVHDNGLEKFRELNSAKPENGKNR